MKVIAFNGSPRKSGNTAELLKQAIKGAESEGVETELVHLYDLDFKGCVSCYACKEKNGKSYGRCVLRDELTPILAKAEEADAVILGAPNYIGGPSSAMKAFIERLLFPSVVYTSDMTSLRSKKILAGFIYVMGSSEEWMKTMGYDWLPTYMGNVLKMIFGSSEVLMVNDVYQFDDYSKYVSSRFDPAAKAKRRDEHFYPVDCRKAFEMGAEFARQSKE